MAKWCRWIWRPPHWTRRRPKILSIAAVPVDAHGVRLSRRFVRSVRGRGDFGIDSIRVHRILPGESAQGEDSMR
ncbi:MAG: hypothetical protein R3F18_06800 [Lysobacterales bacterium]